VFVSAEEMDESMLDLLGTTSEVHELYVSFTSLDLEDLAYITTAGRTLNLKILAVVLVESLQTNIISIISN
jgi:hypothetical protein